MCFHLFHGLMLKDWIKNSKDNSVEAIKKFCESRSKLKDGRQLINISTWHKGIKGTVDEYQPGTRVLKGL